MTATAPCSELATRSAARGVSVVADQNPVAHHDGVDRAHRGGLGRKFVEQIDDRLLVGIGHVDAGETKSPHAVQQSAQGVAVRARDLDKLIVAMQPERFGRLLVHRGRGRMRDRRADQAGEKTFAGCARRYCSRFTRRFRLRRAYALQIGQDHVADLLFVAVPHSCVAEVAVE